MYIVDSGRRARRPGPLDMFFYLGSCQIALQPIVATEEFSSSAHLDNIFPLLSSFCTCDHLGLALSIFQLNENNIVRHFNKYSLLVPPPLPHSLYVVTGIAFCVARPHHDHFFLILIITITISSNVIGA